MGTFKKEGNRRARQGTSGEGLNNVREKGENFYRTGKQVRTLKMREGGKAIRNADGKIVKAAAFQSREIPNARIEPSRKWFNNSRVISQDSLNAFREAMAEKANDPYHVLLRTNKLPMSLIRDGQDTNGLKQHQAKMTVETSPYADVFGPKSRRKRVKLDVSSLDGMAESTEKSMDSYQVRLEQAKLLSGAGDASDDSDHDDAPRAPNSSLSAAVDRPYLKAGQSKRIWNELYKVLDSADVVLQVLDARSPQETRCTAIEKYLKEEAPHKHLVFILNKCDLVPTGVAASWVKHLSKEYPTLAFRSSITNSFGKGSLISLLRQFSSLHSDRKQLSVGLVGGPNVGKSSVINTLKGKKVATVAPIPGETKVWQYVSLMKRIYLIDCPGVVPPSSQDTPTSLVLRGVTRVERVSHPSQYISALLDRVKRHHAEKTYDIRGWADSHEFLELLARKGGRLLARGEPDVDSVAKMVLNDFTRGKLPWYVAPPETTREGDNLDSRQGRLGEMPKKRRQEDITGDTEASAEMQLQLEAKDAQEEGSTNSNASESSEEEFEGFGSETEEASSSRKLSSASSSSAKSLDADGGKANSIARTKSDGLPRKRRKV